MSKSHRSDRKTLIKVGAFGALSITSGALYVVGMIQNGNGAVKRFEALKAADQSGADVTSALNELRSYIYSHMNTEIGGPNGIYPPIQLSGTYQRLVEAEQKRVKDINDQLYTEAQAYCEANGNQGFSGRNRVECQEKYVDENGAKPQEIQEAFYKYDFVAPRWSPDLAGFSLLATIIFSLVTVIYLVQYFRTKHFVNLAN